MRIEVRRMEREGGPWCCYICKKTYIYEEGGLRAVTVSVELHDETAEQRASSPLCRSKPRTSKLSLPQAR